MNPSDPTPQDGSPQPSPPATPPSWITKAAPWSGAAPASAPAEGARLTAQDVAAARRAARYAEHAYAGPIGDLIAKELRAYAQDGRQLPPYAIGPRLVSRLTTQEARHPLPPPRAYTHLPAQHVPGSGLRWRYQSIADVEQPETDRP